MVFVTIFRFSRDCCGFLFSPETRVLYTVGTVFFSIPEELRRLVRIRCRPCIDLENRPQMLSETSDFPEFPKSFLSGNRQRSEKENLQYGQPVVESKLLFLCPSCTDGTLDFFFLRIRTEIYISIIRIYRNT